MRELARRLARELGFGAADLDGMSPGALLWWLGEDAA